MSEQHETVTKKGEKKMISFLELGVPQRSAIIRKRLKEYSKKVYKKTHTQVIEDKTSTVCMRENAFYIDTVRAFRDRRYTYKGEHKKWSNKVVSLTKKLQNTTDPNEAKQIELDITEAVKMVKSFFKNYFCSFYFSKKKKKKRLLCLIPSN